MTGGGPEIRGRTNKVFHKHDIEHVISSLLNMLRRKVVNLGCTPCALAVGIGRLSF